MKIIHAVTALVVIAASIPAFAQSTRIHGEIERLDHSALMVKDRAGNMLDVALTDDARVMVMSKASLADVTAGKFVGTAARAGGPDGELVALEVHIFTESMRGTGEGHRPMASGATMTNATVGSIVKAVNGRVLTLDYRGGVQKVLVPDDVPIVLLAPGEPDMLKPGAHVSFDAIRQADGTLRASRVTVGANGLVPPL